jgi:hypothetical protein
MQRNQKFLRDWNPNPVAFVIEMHSILEQIGLHFPFGTGPDGPNSPSSEDTSVRDCAARCIFTNYREMA